MSKTSCMSIMLAQFAEAIKPIYDKYNKPFEFKFYPFN